MEFREFWMKLEEAIADIEACSSIAQLQRILQVIANELGFACYAFIDVGQPGLDQPFTLTTTDTTWDTTYRDNDFVSVDPNLPVARRTNTPFTWSSVPLPERSGKRKPGAIKCMEASRDHGFKDGLVIPFHFVDQLGRMNSSCCGFFWKDRRSQLLFMLKHKKHDLHILMLYWAQKVMDVAAREFQCRDRFLDGEGVAIIGNVLTDRERDVLSWAGRGRTMSETAEILTISDNTVETHMRSAIHKLGAENKTHAVARAIYLGLIDI